MSSPTPGASPTATSPPPPPLASNSTSPPPPPPPANSSTSTSNSSNPSPPPLRLPPPPNGLATGTLIALIVGIGIGGIIVLVAVGVFVILRRRKRDYGFVGTSSVSLQGSKDDPSVVTPQHWQLNVPPPADNIVPMLQKPTPPGLAPNALLSRGLIPTPPLSPGLSFGFSKSTFSYEELAMATDGFSNANLLGQGGFGYVHKGVLPNGKQLAIKQLKAGSRQGEREFQAEVEIISRVHHKHLVSLVGYCISGDQRMLVYEFVPNSTLEFHLHGKGRPTMSWATRMRIALGSARGLAYLHEDCHPKIIHRDIKATNILLEYNFEAKVADFGLAKFCSDTDTHVSTRVMGTFGYLAPEYASSGKLTEKSDVYSFGVVLLELITGRRPVDKTRSFTDDSMVDWAKPLLTQALEGGNFDTLVDPRLQDYNSSEMARMVSCAAVCVRHSAQRRPRMSQIVRALEGNIPLDDLNEGIKPGHSTVYSSYGSSDFDTSQFKDDLKNFRKMALKSEEHSTDEHSVPTSEHGLLPSSSSSEGQQTTRGMNMSEMKKDMPDFGESS